MVDLTQERRGGMTDEHRDEAARVKAIWDAAETPSQELFGRTWGIGGQTAATQFLLGRTALSVKAALGFARGLSCTVDAFSPRLAAEIGHIARCADETLAARLNGSPPAKAVVPNPPRVELVRSLRYVQDTLSRADRYTLAQVRPLFALLLEDPTDVEASRRIAELLTPGRALSQPAAEVEEDPSGRQPSP